jgi:2-keto-myo-inositol isomerase
MYRSGEKVNVIPSNDSRLLWAFHINDAPAVQVSILRDSDRLMPLGGVMNVREFLQVLQAMKFTGPISVELFNRAYWEMDPDSVLAKAKTSLDELGV